MTETPTATPAHEPAVLVLEDGTPLRGPRLRRPRAHPRRGRLRDRHDRLPGDPDRPVLRRPDRHDDGAAHRQHRHERRGHGVGAHLGRRVRRARPLPRRVELPLAAEPRRRPRGAPGIVGISGIDTRAVTRHIRSAGAMRAGIFSGDAALLTHGEQLELVLGGAEMTGLNLSGDGLDRRALHAARRRASGSAPSPCSTSASRRRRSNYLAERGFDVHVAAAVDHRRGGARAGARRPVLLERARRPRGIRPPRRAAAERRCARACRTSASASATSCSAARSASAPTSCRSATAASTSPCSTRPRAGSRSPRTTTASPSTRRSTGVSESAEGFGRVEVSHYDLNDNVVEGLNCLDIPAFSVQYHPESAAGPHDANYLFDRFRDMVIASKETSA